MAPSMVSHNTAASRSSMAGTPVARAVSSRSSRSPPEVPPPCGRAASAASWAAWTRLAASAPPRSSTPLRDNCSRALHSACWRGWSARGSQSKWRSRLAGSVASPSSKRRAVQWAFKRPWRRSSSRGRREATANSTAGGYRTERGAGGVGLDKR